MLLYVVQMNRWGNNEDHSYTLGAWDTIQEAHFRGKEEELKRDNKYEYQIVTHTLNQTYKESGSYKK